MARHAMPWNGTVWHGTARYATPRLAMPELSTGHFSWTRPDPRLLTKRLAQPTPPHMFYVSRIQHSSCRQETIYNNLCTIPNQIKSKFFITKKHHNNFSENEFLV